MVGHANPRTTQIYDWRCQWITRDLPQYSQELNSGSWGKYWGNYVPYIGHNVCYFNNLRGICGCRRLHHLHAAKAVIKAQSVHLKNRI